MRLVFVLTVALALAPAAALAQRGGAAKSANAPALIKEGERLYKAGKYREAADVLKKANEAQPHPKLLFNIAVALEYAGELRESLTWYQQYVGSSEGTDPELLKKSTRYMERVRAQLEREEHAQSTADADRKRLEAEAESARQRAEQEQLAARRAEEENRVRQQAEQEREMKSYKRQRLGAFAAGGVAVVGVGAGVLFGMQARDARKQFDSATKLADKESFKSDTRSKALLADIGFGVGLVSAITAIVLYPKEGPPAEGEVRVTMAPRGAGAGMEVSF
ncbi:hypothetical protein DRW03_30205 [Corallococcus sp. H22C18031201]|uniref:hypothetical protein n=1 Tax=Citreicoccus inhibens TaxID=2849499 RepID=UPI000E710317|nr:hypothetical protein [Citreicoccus inhibens]MBU8900520.1 hypothetical protein [Citreicoccus inhibens]RJS16571.1 hypothetical protein DRW03_30205 [Corallococcus sp. H22C18031201]